MEEELAVLSRLSMIRDSFTKKEKIVADYIMENIAKLNNTKIEDLANATQIGYSPIYSLLNKLNFKGYRDFIIALSVEQKQMVLNDVHFTNKDDLVNYYIDVLKRNSLVHENEALDRTVKAIRKARNIYVAGIGSTGLGVKEFCNKLVRFGLSAVALNEDEDSIKMQATLLRDTDVFIAMSQTGQTKSVIMAAKLASENHATVIAVSANKTSDLFNYADIKHIVISSGLYQESEVFISPILPILFWIDTVTQLLILQDKSRDYISNRLKTNLVLDKKWD